MGGSLPQARKLCKRASELFFLLVESTRSRDPQEEESVERKVERVLGWFMRAYSHSMVANVKLSYLSTSASATTRIYYYIPTHIIRERPKTSFQITTRTKVGPGYHRSLVSIFFLFFFSWR